MVEGGFLPGPLLIICQRDYEDGRRRRAGWPQRQVNSAVEGATAGASDVRSNLKVRKCGVRTDRPAARDRDGCIA